MNRLLHALVPALVGLLAITAPTQGVVEAKGSKNPALKEVSAKAEQAWKTQDWKTAAAAYGKVVTLSPEDGLAWHHLGYALHAQGRLDEALKAHVKCAEFPKIGSIGAYNAACVFALKGETDKSFKWLQKSREMGFANREQIENDADLKALHDDPRYAEYIASLGHKTAPVAKAYVASTPRQSTRLSFWNDSGSPGQIVLDYGQPAWKDEYSKAIESEKFVGHRWRLGQDFWTTFDTNLDLRVGDAELPAGSYYLTLEKTGEGAFVLAFNDPAKIRRKKLDAYLSHMTKGGIEVEMMHKTVDEIAEKLELGLKPKKADISHAAFVIRFGPHALMVPVEIRF